jgi:hypothetical protein
MPQCRPTAAGTASGGGSTPVIVTLSFGEFRRGTRKTVGPSFSNILFFGVRSEAAAGRIIRTRYRPQKVRRIAR